MRALFQRLEKRVTRELVLKPVEDILYHFQEDLKSFARCISQSAFGDQTDAIRELVKQTHEQIEHVSSLASNLRSYTSENIRFDPVGPVDSWLKKGRVLVIDPEIFHVAEYEHVYTSIPSQVHFQTLYEEAAVPPLRPPVFFRSSFGVSFAVFCEVSVPYEETIIPVVSRNFASFLDEFRNREPA
ncbi:MAG: hypothetical protein D6698_01655 [Gammaproteobacteria bacterium]|nr:MAG: hypothetical protein D6698_01655 [Gammaproteobacteria bacterium]